MKEERYRENRGVLLDENDNVIECERKLCLKHLPQIAIRRREQ